MARRKNDRQSGGGKRRESVARVEMFKKEVVTDCHQIPLKDLCHRYNTDSERGITKKLAIERLAKNGPNALTPTRQDPECIKFIKLITQGFSLLLWIGTILCLIAVLIEFINKGNLDIDNLILSSVLVVIILVTGIFMYFQQRKSSKIMDSFANMIPQIANAIRDGHSVRVNVTDLVIGDLVEIKFGDRIPADVRIVKSSGFKVDNSSITGETEALLRTTQCTNENFLETRNIAFFSTNAVEGTAMGIVVMTGDLTVMGRIAGLTARLQPSSTPIARELHRFMKVIAVWACCVGVVFGVASVSMGYNWIDSVLFIIGIIVANVPEGLLATVTVSLTVTAKKMAAKNCLVKNLEAVETLGSTSVICSDKTGTLTQNKMTVCHLWYNNKSIIADTSSDQYDARRYNKKDDEGFMSLMRIATLCNRAEFRREHPRKPILKRLVNGDASEAAILRFVELTRAHGSPRNYRLGHHKLIEIPFSSVTKYQVSLHHFGDQVLLVMKGAPERILQKCTDIYWAGSTIEITEEHLAICNQACLELAARGERVLGFADLILNKDEYPIEFPYTVDPTPNFPLSGLRFVGLISLVDPPRPTVHDAVERCRKAGIKVIMVTGDHPVTAEAIAKQVGIITPPPEGDEDTRRMRTHIEPTNIVITGTMLKEMDPDELDEILYSYKEIVFARTSPTQKLQIVEGLQRLGKIVAVTGDGVNDAPALKKADIGVAMGISGSEVSQQSADMILLDDNFASIITGIEEGRKIFDNLKKSIVYTLASNIPELLPFLLFILLNIPLPLTVLAVLSIDMLTDMMPAISMAYERAETNIMLRPPRNPNKDNLVTFRLYFLAYGHIGVIEAFAGLFVYFCIMNEYGFKPDRLVGLRREWDSYYINDLEDSYGQQWTYAERKQLEYTCSTAYLIAVVICQWGDIIACKTRYNSIVVQGMGNWILNMSIIIETVITVFLAYMPYMYYLKFYPIKFRWWLYPLPFSALIVLFDELRKFCIRNNPSGYFYRETYY